MSESFEPKKLALLRIWQILKEYSDAEHPLTQEEIAAHLAGDYGIVIERKAISRNLSLLREAGCEIASGRDGCYLAVRDFEDAELRLLIDGVLCSRHISARHSADLINRLCGLSNKHFRAHVKHIWSVNDWSKTDNPALFLNIEIIDAAIGQHLRIGYDYNKFGIDKKLHKSSHQVVSPYRLILHNQRYYLMAYSEYWGNMVFHRIERMTNMTLTKDKATPLRSIPGYEHGIDSKHLATGLPYMYADKPERIEFIADAIIADQIVDWFGSSVRMTAGKADPTKLLVSVTASPQAMVHWALQYLNHVEITAPAALRERIRESLHSGIAKYDQE